MQLLWLLHPRGNVAPHPNGEAAWCYREQKQKVNHHFNPLLSSCMSVKSQHFCHPESGEPLVELSSLSALAFLHTLVIFSAKQRMYKEKKQETNEGAASVWWEQIHVWSMLIHMSRLLVVIPTLVSLDSLHCTMKFLCLDLICKVEAYLVALCKRSKSTLNYLKTDTMIRMPHTLIL